MASTSHTMDIPPCPDNTEDARSKPDPESSSEAKEGKWQILDQVLDPKGPILQKWVLDLKGRILQNWNMIFAGSCVLAVLLDPLFLYIPILNDDMKCIGIDKNLKIVALVLRSFTDLIHIVKIIFQICQPEKSPETRESFVFVNGGAQKRAGGSQSPSENAEKKLMFNYIPNSNTARSCSIAA
ncbi:hypothetical protein ABKV19_023864 [Rosa sericea]